MFVYMTRKERRQWHRVVGLFGRPGVGSRETVRLVLEEAALGLEEAATTLNLVTGACTCDDPCQVEDCAACIAIDGAGDLSAALDELLNGWRTPSQQVVSVARRWWFPKERRPVARVLPPDGLLSWAMEAAVVAATELVSNGETEKVKTALAMVGSVRVSEIPDGDVPAFLAALAP